jgi:hypothetical protein
MLKCRVEVHINSKLYSEEITPYEAELLNDG